MATAAWGNLMFLSFWQLTKPGSFLFTLFPDSHDGSIHVECFFSKPPELNASF